MSRIYKICVVNQSNENANEVFAIKPYLESFDSFKDEIYIRMPELKNQPLKIYYQDAEGDNITIFNALDFGIFQEQKINKVFVVKNAPAKSVQFQEKPITKSTATTSSASASASSAAPSQRVLHPNVVCDGCDKDIFGYRYKCLECADFDLCMECEPKLHNHHLMIRITDPSDAEICHKSKLGKRFLRHRRSESLCTKSDDKEKKHHHHPHPHHKRHASNASGVRPPTVGDVLHSVLQTLTGAGNAPPNSNLSSNQQPTTNTEAKTTKPADTAEKKQPKTKSASTGTTPILTPTSCPYGFNIPTENGKPPLKNGMDMLSHVAQNFAAMMDPFATFMEQSANAYASAASASAAATTASTNASESAATAAAKEDVATSSANVSSQTAAENTETTAVNTDQVSSDKPTEKQNTVMIVDCSDDEDEDLRKLVTALNVDQKKTDETASATNEKNERSASIDADKSSPSREWTFIEPNEIAEVAGASGISSGAIPKKTTPPAAENSGSFNRVDYAELSRLLSTHIDAQNQATPTAPAQTDNDKQSTQAEAAEKDTAKSSKTPPPTPSLAEARVNESLNAMIAMGFSNEGGWLSQLLETVDGSISNALDLLQPHK